jgi:hypothetical protein
MVVSNVCFVSWRQQPLRPRDHNFRGALSGPYASLIAYDLETTIMRGRGPDLSRGATERKEVVLIRRLFRML